MGTNFSATACLNIPEALNKIDQKEEGKKMEFSFKPQTLAPVPPTPKKF